MTTLDSTPMPTPDTTTSYSYLTPEFIQELGRFSQADLVRRYGKVSYIPEIVEISKTHKIVAIKILREILNLGLKEAKETVELLSRTHVLVPKDDADRSAQQARVEDLKRTVNKYAEATYNLEDEVISLKRTNRSLEEHFETLSERYERLLNVHLKMMDVLFSSDN